MAAVLASNSIAAKEISGKVENIEGKALTNAVVKVRGSQTETRTDSEGNFVLDLPVGEHIIDVEGGSQAHFHQVIQVTDSQQAPFILSLADKSEHKIVIRSNPLDRTSLDMASPTVVIAGDELILKRAGTLGEILQSEPGISVASFGPSVSRPVIRGLSDARVTITNNQMTVQDASTTSGDHDVGIEPMLAEQIEVIKGPATLLYGSGAIGGVVNVVDRKISADEITELSGGVELRLGDSVTGEESLIFTLDGGNEDWNWHLDGYTSETDDLEIPGFAESEILHEAEEHEDEHEGEEEEHEEEEGVEGLLENSKSETTGGSFGLTRVGDWGHFGFAVSSVDKTYGLPGHSHHHEEEHEEGEEEHEEEEHHEEEEEVALDMQQTRYDIQAMINNPFGGFDGAYIGYAYTDYEHVEQEGDETGTMFSNEAWELKSYLKHSDWSGWSGIWGIQITERDFAAIGEEAFVPPSVTSNQALFVVEEKTVGNFKFELGARYESQTVEVAGQNDVDESGLSFSFGTIYTISHHNILAFNYSRANRFAIVEELFSEGPHLATQSFEVGNSSLDKETSNNFDISYRFETERVFGEFNLYWNQFDDFIYGDVVAETDPCLPAGAAEEAEEEELQLVCYKQEDADFNGVEFKVDFLLNPGSQHQFSIGLLADYVNAELDNSGYVPRTPASKTGVNFNYDFGELSASVDWLNYDDKTKVATNELPTNGFDIVNLDIAYRLPVAENELFLFFKGKNLLDEEARDHTSFIKDLAPRAGRNFVIGARYTF